MIYSTSRQKSLNRCSRYFYHQYIQGYYEVSKKPWLKIGSDIDDLLAIYDTEGYDIMLQNLSQRFTEPYEAIEYTHLLKHYHEKYGLKQPLSPVSVDGQEGNQFHFNLNLNPSHIENCDIKVQGYLDKVTEIDGWTSIVERKTTSAPINYTSAYWKNLEVDKQVVCYSWALSTIIESPVNKVVYEVLRKPSSVSSKFLNRKDKKKNPVPLDEYNDMVAEYFLKPTQTMVHRKNLWVTQQARDEWVHDLVADDDSIRNMELNQSTLESGGIDGRYAWSRNQGACKEFGGCQFCPVCVGETEIEGLQTVYLKED